MLVSRLFGVISRAGLVSRALRRLLAARDPQLRVNAMGIEFPSPLGVAAGMDKDATWFEGLGALGFGCVEIGTVTAHPQAGNEGKRIYRLLPDRGLLNRMGFPNAGCVATATRLQARSGATIVGANIGKSKAATAEDANADFCMSAAALAPLADYLVINVSSPNTPGLRAMQSIELLRSLIHDVRDAVAEAGATLPLLVKIAPDLHDDEIDAVADLAVELRLDGLIAVNTTTDRASISGDPHLPLDGGVSGRPLKPRAVEILRRLHARVGSELVLVSVGGVESAADVEERLRAGARLVQVHTGFVYGGPLWPWKVNRHLARSVSAAGFASVENLIGVDALPAAQPALVSDRQPAYAGAMTPGSRSSV